MKKKKPHNCEQASLIHTPFGRRSLIGGALGAGAFMSLGRVGSIFAEEPTEYRFVSVYFSGGWDTLLGPEARDPSKTYEGIDLGLEFLTGATEKFATPITAEYGDGSTSLWGEAMRGVLTHSKLATVFSSVNMNTVAHGAGRAYVNTFRQPAGTVARGDSFGTLMATGSPIPPERILPNVSIGLPSYNTQFAPSYSGIRTSRATEVVDLLKPIGTQLPPEIQAKLMAAQDASKSCVGSRYRGRTPAEDLLSSRARVRKLMTEDVGRFFDIAAAEPNAEVTDLYERFGLDLTTARDSRDPLTIAAISGQLFRLGLTRSLAISIQGGMDTHRADWGTAQGPRQEAGWDAIGKLVTDLEKDDPGLSRTFIAVHSEFARTPKINGNNGRDHHFPNSVVVFSGALKSGQVGRTQEQTHLVQKTNFTTGLPDEDGQMLKPEHIGATIATAAGIDPEPFRVAPLDAWIKGGA